MVRGSPLVKESKITPVTLTGMPMFKFTKLSKTEEIHLSQEQSLSMLTKIVILFNTLFAQLAIRIGQY